MFYIKNLPMWERAMRVGAGIVAISYALLNSDGMFGWVVIAIGAGIAVSGVLGFCPACALAGRRLNQRNRHNS